MSTLVQHKVLNQAALHTHRTLSAHACTQSIEQVSTLVKIETPLGEDKVPNQAALQRAREADLNKPTGYQVCVIAI